MSLKAIEMQIALPRTQDAGKIQEQLQQRGQIQNDHASDSVKKEDERKEKGIIKQEQKDIARFHKEGNRKDHESQERQKKEKKESQHIESHPYKGKYFDFSG